MSDVDNPYRAPEAPNSDDFIAYEPIRRPMAYTIAAYLCWYIGVTSMIGLSLGASALVRLSIKHGWGDVLRTGSISRMTGGLALVGVASVTFMFAGRSFKGRKARRGLVLGSLAWVLNYTAKEMIFSR